MNAIAIQLRHETHPTALPPRKALEPFYNRTSSIERMLHNCIGELVPKCDTGDPIRHDGVPTVEDKVVHDKRAGRRRLQVARKHPFRVQENRVPQSGLTAKLLSGSNTPKRSAIFGIFCSPVMHRRFCSRKSRRCQVRASNQHLRSVKATGSCEAF